MLVGVAVRGRFLKGAQNENMNQLAKCVNEVQASSYRVCYMILQIPTVSVLYFGRRKKEKSCITQCYEKY